MIFKTALQKRVEVFLVDFTFFFILNKILKVPKCEVFDLSDFHYFYTIKTFWVDDFVIKILTYYFDFWGSQASFIF
jgi:hypothetical protein